MSEAKTFYDHEVCVAFLYGWRDAYDCGEDNNPFTEPSLNHAYCRGYEMGARDRKTKLEEAA